MIRPTLPFHGGDIAAFAKRCRCRPDKIVDFSSNINCVIPHVPPFANIRRLQPYYDDGSLRRHIGAYYGVKTHHTELFSGASSAIYALFGYLTRQKLVRRCVLFAPLYGEYARAAEAFGLETIRINRFKTLQIDCDLSNTLVVFVNPATPEGSIYDTFSLVSSWLQRGATVLVDESFIEFANARSLKSKIGEHRHLFILQSTSKYWGAAGVRVGALFGSKSHMERLRGFEAPWKISAFDAHYLQHAMRDETFHMRSQSINRANKMRLLRVLKNKKIATHIFPSYANYVTVKLRTGDAFALQAHLQKARILVRNCANFDFLDARYVRFSINTSRDIERLRKALDGYA
jgi:threonine-phosphate decarboxylase